MACITLENVAVDFPIYHGARSLKKTILQHTVGGIIGYDERQRTCIHALTDISFELVNGDRVGVIGSNGAGKTTLLRALAGIYEPARGRLRIDGKVTSLIDCNSGFDSESSGYENLFLRSSILGFPRSATEAKIADIVECSELGDFVHLPMRMYSSGMQSRLVFAAVTAMDTEVLLLDEWLSAGDANFVEKARRRAEEFVRRPSIMVIASHNNEIIRKICNKALWLEHGRLQAFGPIDEVLERYDSAAAAANAAAVAA